MITTDLGQRLARTRHALTIAPDVMQHIVSMRDTATKSNQPRVQQSKEPPVPVNVTAVDDSDYVYQSLAYWAGVFVERLSIQGPLMRRNARRTDDGTVIGFGSTITPNGAHNATRAIAGWMLERLDRFASQHPAELREFADDINTIHTLRTKWPTEEGGTQSATPCPHHDDTVPIVIYPPLEYGMPRVIVCDHSHYFDDNNFATIEAEHHATIRQRIIDRKKASRMMNDLTKRYAPQTG